MEKEITYQNSFVLAGCQLGFADPNYTLYVAANRMYMRRDVEKRRTAFAEITAKELAAIAAIQGSKTVFETIEWRRKSKKDFAARNPDCIRVPEWANGISNWREGLKGKLFKP